MEFPKRLRELRLQRGLTQQEMADLLNMTNQNYGRFETQNANPKINTLIKMAQILGVSVDYLLGTGELTTETEEGKLAKAAYWTKQLVPDFKLEYKNGYYYLIVLQDLNSPFDDINNNIKAGANFKISQTLLQAITSEIDRAITETVKTERKKSALQIFKVTAIQQSYFQHIVKCMQYEKGNIK